MMIVQTFNSRDGLSPKWELQPVYEGALQLCLWVYNPVPLQDIDIPARNPTPNLVIKGIYSYQKKFS